MQHTSSGAPGGPVLTPLQREQFLETGMLRLPAAVPTADLEPVLGRVWAMLEQRHGMVRGRPETWTVPRPTKLQALSKSGAFDALAGPRLRSQLDQVFDGRGWSAPWGWGQALLTFREDEAPWDLPHVAWHIDLVSDEVLEPWPRYVRLFALLAPIEPGGGGTVWLAGSHRLAMRMMRKAADPGEIRCAALREALKRQDPWISALCSPGAEGDRIERFMKTGAEVGGVRLRAMEITGDAGDVFLMHPATLHAAAPTARPEPRLMVGATIVAKS
jgi:hypothetical protein